MTLTELSIKRPTLIVVIFAVLTFLGVISYFSLNYELLPKYSEPVLVIVTPYPGASPSEVENSVTKKIEDAISSLEDIDNIQSTSAEGNSVVVIIFKNGADMAKALQNASMKVSNVEYMLPKDVRKPIISNFSMSDIPIIRLGITSDIPATELSGVSCLYVPACVGLPGVELRGLGYSDTAQVCGPREYDQPARVA